MRILLVANYEPDAQESMLRYAFWLQRTLKERGHQINVTAPKPVFSKFARRQRLKKYLGYLDKFLLFPRQLRRMAQTCDLVHVLDHSNSMYLSAVRERASLITCHDVLAIRAARGEFPQVSVGWSGRLLQRWILSGLRSAPHIVCDSAKTAKDLMTLTGKEGDRRKQIGQLRVIHIPLNWGYRPCAPFPPRLGPRLGLKAGECYFLHVGGNQWYKNRAGVLRIFARLVEQDAFSAAKLVMAGKACSADVLELTRDEGIADRVIQAVGVSNEELQALYGNSLALLFPSLEEGFGWPILEAQACGCPVITSFREPMSEVAGDAAILIDPEDSTAAAAIIGEGLQDSQRLRAAGFRNLSRFSDEAITDQYCAYYEEIVRSASASMS